jgi:hypothetical protein
MEMEVRILKPHLKEKNNLRHHLASMSINHHISLIMIGLFQHDIFFVD